jgi:tetratricopeptide (TPR) repeat protein
VPVTKAPNLVLRRIRELERQETRAEFAEAITRKARELGESVAPTERYVAKLEDGDVRYPYPAYRRVLTALCGRSMAELGFTSPLNRKYRVPGDENREESLPGESAQDMVQSPHAEAAGEILPTYSDEVSRTLRRDFVKLSGSLVAGNMLGMAENELTRIHMALSRGTTNDERISYLEECADDLGIQAARAAPVLRSALAALSSVRALLEERQPTRYQARLVAVSAKLSTVVGEQMFNAGQLKQASEWHKTARYAAHDTGNLYLADIALAQQAFVPMYSGELAEVLRLIAPRLDGNPSPSPAVAFLWGIRARAHAALGEKDSFKRSIEEARDLLDHSEPAQISPGILSFDPAKLAFYETTGAVTLNDLDTALDAAERALALFGKAEKYDPVLVRLDRASALAKAGEVPEACRTAKAAILDATTFYALSIRAFAHKFTKEIQTVQSPDTREWREVLAEVEKGTLSDRNRPSPEL